MRFAIAALFFALLSGCSVPQIPERMPIEAGVFSSAPEKSRYQSVPSGENVSVGVLLNKNTNQNIAYLQQFYENPDFGSPGFDGDLKEAVAYVTDPDFVVRWVMKSLKDRFGSVKVFDDVKSLSKESPDVTVLIDMQFQIPAGMNDTALAFNTLRFYDSSQKFIAEATGRKSRKYNTWANETMEQVIQRTRSEKLVLIQSLEELDESIDKIISKPRLKALRSSDDYDKCMRNVIRIVDIKLRLQAMNTCQAVK